MYQALDIPTGELIAVKVSKCGNWAINRVQKKFQLDRFRMDPKLKYDIGN